MRLLILLWCVLLETSLGLCVHNAQKVNDNFCDCLEGGQGDEKETSACSPHGQFQCKGESLIIPSSRVHDSVCDCCDGSDELVETKFCPNTCAEKQQKLEAERKSQAETRSKGETLFRELVMKACTLDDVDHHDNNNIANREQELEEAKQIRDAELSKLEPQRVESLQLLQLPVEQLASLVVKLIQRNSRDDLDAFWVESFLQDEGVSNAKWLEDSEQLVSAKERILQLEMNHDEEDEEADHHHSHANKALRVEDYGMGKVWKSLEHECFELKKQEYLYTLCVLKDFKQDSNSLGQWEGWQSSGVMSFTKGAYCHIGVNRSVKVKVQCGVENKLLDVVEPSTCVYEATFQSPAACIPSDFAESEVCAAMV